MDNPENLATQGTQDLKTKKRQKLAAQGTQDEDKKKHKTICVGHHYTQTNTNNVNKTYALLQTTGGKDEPNIVLYGNRNGHHNRVKYPNEFKHMEIHL